MAGLNYRGNDNTRQSRDSVFRPPVRQTLILHCIVWNVVHCTFNHIEVTIAAANVCQQYAPIFLAGSPGGDQTTDPRILESVSKSD